MFDPILQILINNGYLDEQGAKDVADLAKTESKTIRQQVIDDGIISEDDLLACMAADQNTEAVDLGAMTIDTEVTEAIPDRRGRHLRHARDLRPRRPAHLGRNPLHPLQ